MAFSQIRHRLTSGSSPTAPTCSSPGPRPSRRGRSSRSTSTAEARLAWDRATLPPAHPRRRPRAGTSGSRSGRSTPARRPIDNSANLIAPGGRSERALARLDRRDVSRSDRLATTSRGFRVFQGSEPRGAGRPGSTPVDSRWWRTRADGSTMVSARDGFGGGRFRPGGHALPTGKAARSPPANLAISPWSRSTGPATSRSDRVWRRA